MQIILLEKVANVGNLGDVVKVKHGFARNFLIPQGKAKRATPENLKLLEAKRAELESGRGREARGGAGAGGEARRARRSRSRRRPASTAACSARSTNVDIVEALKAQGIDDREGAWSACRRAR